MFHFPTFPPHALYIQARVTGLVIQPGFPIRKSSNHSSVASSSRLIAGSYVLHRLLVPRHPPCALKNLPQKLKDARVHYAVLKLRTEPATSTGAYPAPAPTNGTSTRRFTAAATRESTTHQRTGARSLRTQQRAGPTPPTSTFHPPHECRRVLAPTSSDRPNSRRSTHEQPPRNTRPGSGPGPTPTTHPDQRGRQQQRRASMLLRKEVIQPHLPVRLPCYDFVPIASPTFDDSLPQGVGPSASGVTDFRDVTGGVYKARERIHRSVADLRLLATPTSRGRVADPDPN